MAKQRPVTILRSVFVTFVPRASTVARTAKMCFFGIPFEIPQALLCASCESKVMSCLLLLTPGMSFHRLSHKFDSSGKCSRMKLEL